MSSQEYLVYLDASVILRAVREESIATRTWLLDQQDNHGATFVASRLMSVEVHRVMRRAGLNTDVAERYLATVALIEVTKELCENAIALPHTLSGADSIHLATALSLPYQAMLATHDRELASAAQATNRLTVVDPVTDDLNSLPVA